MPDFLFKHVFCYKMHFINNSKETRITAMFRIEGNTKTE